MGKTLQMSAADLMIMIIPKYHTDRTQMGRTSVQEYLTESYKFELCRVIEEKRILQRPVQLQDRLRK